MIQYALLGLLREHADYGYNLKRRFDARLGMCWELNVGQVYQTLHALRRAGFVSEIRQEASAGAPARRMFALTGKGGRFLERWLRRAPGSPRPVRDEIVIRLLIHGPEGIPALLDHVARQERLHRSRFDRLLALRDRAVGDDLSRRLNLEAAVRHTEAHLGWLEYCRTCLEAWPESAVAVDA